MRTLLLVSLLATAAVAQEPGARLAAICSGSGGIARLGTLGVGLGGRSIHVVTIATGGPLAENERPAILVVAGVDGSSDLGTELAIAHVEHLVRDHRAGHAATRALLAERVIHVVPLLNPDGAALGRAGNARALDLDRDGRSDEDGPRDLDGDGVVAQMRWPDVDGEWLIDPNDARFVRKADRKAGERGTHSLSIECADQDGDEARGEDPGRGVAIARNFAQRHTEFDREAGPFPMSEPETRALAEFVLAHRNLAMAIVWDRDDVLLATPKAGQERARVQFDGIHADDVALYERVGKLYRERTRRSGESSPRMDGSTWSWLYAQLGIPTFASDVWRVPRGGKEGDVTISDDLARSRACEAAGKGFVAWHPYRHPQLADVEIGGFVTGRDHELCTQDERSTVFAAHHGFLLELAAMGPRVSIRSFTTRELGGGAVRVEAVVVNDGDWPTLCGMASHTRRYVTGRVKLVLGDAELLAGDAQQTLPELDALGGKHEFGWVVTGKPGTRLALEIALEPAGKDRKEVTL